jgi:hypothetical protein
MSYWRGCSLSKTLDEFLGRVKENRRSSGPAKLFLSLPPGKLEIKIQWIHMRHNIEEKDRCFQRYRTVRIQSAPVTTVQRQTQKATTDNLISSKIKSHNNIRNEENKRHEPNRRNNQDKQ